MNAMRRAVDSNHPRFAQASALVLTLCGLLSAATTSAGPNANAKIMLHVARVDIGICASNGGRPSCGLVRTSSHLYPAPIEYIALIVTDADVAAGIAAVECGIAYDPVLNVGVDMFSWTLCADTEAPVAGPNGPWPASGSGIIVSWDVATHCQRYQPPGSPTAVALAGYFYCAAYTPGTLEVVTSPVSGLAAVASCAAVVDTVEGGFIHRNPPHLGSVRYSASGLEPGYNPCGLVTPVEATTWSAIKRGLASSR